MASQTGLLAIGSLSRAALVSRPVERRFRAIFFESSLSPVGGRRQAYTRVCKFSINAQRREGFSYLWVDRYGWYVLRFHGGNTGSNPVGEANYINKIEAIEAPETAAYGKNTA